MSHYTWHGFHTLSLEDECWSCATSYGEVQAFRPPCDDYYPHYAYHQDHLSTSYLHSEPPMNFSYPSCSPLNPDAYQPMIHQCPTYAPLKNANDLFLRPINSAIPQVPPIGHSEAHQPLLQTSSAHHPVMCPSDYPVNEIVHPVDRTAPYNPGIVPESCFEPPKIALFVCPMKGCTRKYRYVERDLSPIF